MKKTSVHQERLTMRKFIDVSLKIGDRAERSKRLTFLYFITHLRSSPLYYSLLYPHHPAYIGSPWIYFKQSRLVLQLTYLVRLFYFLTKRGFKVDVFQAEKEGKHIQAVVDHNLWELFNIFAFSRGRIERMMYLLELSGAKYKGKTLCIGPRNEGEILLFQRHGFKDVVGIDLFSYCPSILLMDVHHMTFSDNAFDTIYLGASLPYFSDMKQAVNEIVRVARPGARVACSLKVQDLGELDPFVGNEVTLKEALGLFGEHVAHVYFRDDAEYRPGSKHQLVFEIKK